VWQTQQLEGTASAEVERLLAAGEPQAALERANDTLAQHPASASLRLAKAQLLEHLAHPGDALVCLDEVLEVTAASSPFSPTSELRYNAHARKAQLLWHLDRCEEALAACEEALAHFGRDPLFHSYKGLLLFRRGVWAAALESFEYAFQYARHGGDSPLPLAFHLMNKGNALSALGRYQEAAHAYTLAKRKSDLTPPLRPALFYNLACTQALLGRDQEALSFLREIDAQGFESTWVHFAQAEVLSVLGRDQEAVAVYQLADPGATGIDRRETRRSLYCRLSCPLVYEGPGEDPGTFQWHVGSPEPVRMQTQEENAPLDG
jgi:tetratricopeptide (TPR) repeat protein